VASLLAEEDRYGVPVREGLERGEHRSLLRDRRGYH